MSDVLPMHQTFQFWGAIVVRQLSIRWTNCGQTEWACAIPVLFHKKLDLSKLKETLKFVLNKQPLISPKSTSTQWLTCGVPKSKKEGNK